MQDDAGGVYHRCEGRLLFFVKPALDLRNPTAIGWGAVAISGRVEGLANGVHHHFARCDIGQAVSLRLGQ